jgi:hypothetical protein
MMLEPKARDTLDEWIKVLQAGGEMDATATNAASMLSLAISMKRIADEVCGVPYDNAPGADNSKNRMGLTDGIMHAIEQGITAASQRG